jgi:hypothetical protein
MNTRTHTATFKARQETVFGFLSDVENLPTWATAFCRGLRKEGSDYKVETPDGEVFFRIDHDAKTGVVDMTSGPTKDQMMTYPIRVAALPDGSSLLTFTTIQPPEMPDEAFAAMCVALEGEFDNIRRAVE